jgi:hypothetical protein
VIICEIGDIFRRRFTGREYELRRITDHMVVLHSLDGLSQILTGKDSLDLFYEKFSDREKLK